VPFVTLMMWSRTRLIVCGLPLVGPQGRLGWPIWTAPLRLADLEAALCCGWSWPTMEARRWLSGKFYCFSRGELREPEVSRDSAEVRGLSCAPDQKLSAKDADRPGVLFRVNSEVRGSRSTTQGFLRALEPMMGSGLVTLERVQVLQYGSRQNGASS
jgi:hypothetical protein